MRVENNLLPLLREERDQRYHTEAVGEVFVLNFLTEASCYTYIIIILEPYYFEVEMD